MGYAELPEDADSSMLESDEFLGRFHHALLELHLEEDALVCPETGRRFPVNKGIPNMLLHEDEVIAETNRADILDLALMRSGRLDRKIEFPHPTEEVRARILQVWYLQTLSTDFFLSYSIALLSYVWFGVIREEISLEAKHLRLKPVMTLGF